MSHKNETVFIGGYNRRLGRGGRLRLRCMDSAATRATSRAPHAVEHNYLGNSNVGFSTGVPADEVGGPAVGSYDEGAPDPEHLRPNT
jgi:hypothetical protein